MFVHNCLYRWTAVRIVLGISISLCMSTWCMCVLLFHVYFDNTHRHIVMYLVISRLTSCCVSLCRLCTSRILLYCYYVVCACVCSVSWIELSHSKLVHNCATHLHSYTQIYTHTYTHRRIHTHIYIYTGTHTHKDIHTHTHSHRHTPKDARAHIHAYTNEYYIVRLYIIKNRNDNLTRMHMNIAWLGNVK